MRNYVWDKIRKYVSLIMSVVLVVSFIPILKSNKGYASNDLLPGVDNTAKGFPYGLSSNGKYALHRDASTATPTYTLVNTETNAQTTYQTAELYTESPSVSNSGVVYAKTASGIRKIDFLGDKTPSTIVSSTGIRAVKVSHDNTKLAYLEDNGVNSKLYVRNLSTSTNTLIDTFTKPSSSNPTLFILFSPDSSSILYADHANNTVRVWNGSSVKSLSSSHFSGVSGFFFGDINRFAYDGSYFYVNNQNSFFRVSIASDTSSVFFSDISKIPSGNVALLSDNGSTVMYPHGSVVSRVSDKVPVVLGPNNPSSTSTYTFLSGDGSTAYFPAVGGYRAVKLSGLDTMPKTKTVGTVHVKPGDVISLGGLFWNAIDNNKLVATSNLKSRAFDTNRYAAGANKFSLTLSTNIAYDLHYNYFNNLSTTEKQILTTAQYGNSEAFVGLPSKADIAKGTVDFYLSDEFWLVDDGPAESAYAHKTTRSVSDSYSVTGSRGIRPVITIKSNALFTGTGTIFDPYVPSGLGEPLPGTPTNFRTSSILPTSIALAWNSVSGAQEYVVKRGGVEVYRGTGTSTNVTGLSASTSYNFELTAVNSSGSSAAATLTAATIANPTTPTGLSSPSSNHSQAMVTWSVVAGVQGYVVYRNSVEVYRGTSTSFLDTGLTAETSYQYTVASYNGSATSAPSSPVTVTTTAAPVGGTSVPVKFKGSPVVDGGFYYSHAIADDGTLWGWGQNADGTLGLSDTTSGDKLQAVKVGSATNWMSISTGLTHSLAITTITRELWGWGDNATGKLGNGSTTGKTIQPTKIGSDQFWQKAAAGWGNNSYAIKQTGELYSWGSNTYGATGLGTATGNTTTPTKVGTANTWVDVAAGDGFALAVKNDGTLWAMGDNSSGRTGQGTALGATTTPTRIGTDSNWVSVSAGGQSSFGLKSDGSLWAWGSSGNGQLGLGSTSTQNLNPIRVGTDSNWSKVFAGYRHTVALKTNGTLWVWGDNTAGRTGLGLDTGNTLTPTQLGIDTDWTFVAPSLHQTVAVKSNGDVYTWGNNQYGMTGVNSSTGNTLLPMKITISAPPTPPSAPASFTKGTVTHDSVSLSWGTVADATSYKVLRDGVTVYSGTATLYTDIGLTAETAYSYSVVAVNGNGESTPSTLSATTGFAPLLAPSNFISSSVTKNSVSLSWDAVSGAMGYKVYRDGTEVYSGPALSFSDTGLSYETAYAYTVVGFNANVTSPTSALSITTLADSVATPTNFRATSVGTSSIVFAWDVVADATGYSLERNGTVIYTGNDLTYTDNSLSAATQYSYVLKAVKGAISSPAENLSITTALSSPTGFTASPVTDTSVTLSWNLVPDADSYELKRGPDVIYTGPLLTYTDAGRTEQTTYNYSLIAKKLTVESAPVTTSATTGVSPLATPTNFVATSVGETSLTLSWDSVPGATSYEVKNGPTVIYTGSLLTYNVTGLNADTAYTFTVIAKKAGVDSLPSSVSVTTDFSTPAMPSPFTVGSASSSSLTLSWGTVPGVTGYKIYREGTEIGSSTGSSFIDGGLTHSTTYNYTLVAYRGSKTSPSAAASGTTLAPSPDTPSGIVISGITENSLLVSWNASANATQYEISRDGTLIATQAGLSFADFGLSPNTTYVYTVVAVNSGNVKSAPGIKSATTDSQTPATVTGLTYSDATHSSLKISWNALPGVDGYIIKRDGNEIFRTASINYTDSGLSPIRLYTYQVYGYVGAKQSLMPATIHVSTLEEPLSQVTVFNAVSMGEDQVMISWNFVGPATSYDLFRGATLIYSGPNGVFTDTGLTPGTNYNYSIVAKKGAMASTPAYTSVTTNPSVMVPKPTLIITAISETSVSLLWSSTVTADTYVVSRGAQVIYTGQGTIFTDIGLQPNTTYTYSVVTKKGAYDSAPTTLNATTLQHVPLPKPAFLVASGVTDSSVELSWTVPVGADGVTVKRGATIIYSGTATSFTDTGLNHSTPYTYVAYATRGMESGEPVMTSITTLPKTPLATPSSFVKTSVTETTVGMAWGSVTGADGYEVRRGATLVYSGSSLSFEDTGLTEDTSYIYTLVAKKGSEYSAPITLPVTTSKAADKFPKYSSASEINFRSSNITKSSVKLGWNSMTNATAYEVKRNDEDVVYYGSSLNFMDSGLDLETIYQYSLVGRNSFGDSIPLLLNVKTLGEAPAKPTGFKVIRVYPGAIATQWAQASGATSYKLIRVEAEGDVVVYEGSLTTFKDDNLTAETTYTYKVIAINAYGQTASDTITGTTIAEQPTVAITPTEATYGQITFSFKVIEGGFEYMVERNPQWSYVPQPDGTYHKTYFNSVTGETRDYGIVTIKDGMLDFAENNVSPSTQYHYDITAFKRRDDGVKEVVSETEVTIETPADNGGATVPKPIEGGKLPSDPGNGNGGNPGNGNGNNPDPGNGGNNPGNGNGTDPGNGNNPGNGNGNNPDPGNGGNNPGNGNGTNPGTVTNVTYGGGGGWYTPPTNPEIKPETKPEVVKAFCKRPEKKSSFFDTIGHWGFKHIDSLAGRSIVNGYPDGSFLPDQHITRAEFVAVVVRSLCEDELEAGKAFDDVNPSDWYFNLVNVAAEKGYIEGVSDHLFNPLGLITRQEIATIISRVSEAHGLLDSVEASEKPITDIADVDTWAKDHVVKLVSKGIIEGREEGKIVPSAKATRAEISAVVDRILERGQEPKNIK